MTQKTEYQDSGPEMLSEHHRDSDRKTRIFGLCSLSALSVLLIALLLISFDLRLPAGIMTVAGLALGIVAYKNAILLFRHEPVVNQAKDEGSGQAEQELNFSGISHDLREHLNDLVLISDILLKSDLPKKQKDLALTLAASTRNMVSVVNELTIQPVPDIKPEHSRKMRFNILTTIQNTIHLYSLKQKSFIDPVLNKKDLSEYECEGDPVFMKQIFLNLFKIIEDQCDGRTVRLNINVSKENKDKSHFNANFRIQTDRKINFTAGRLTRQTMAVKLISSLKGTYSQEDGENFSVFNFTIPFVASVAEKIISIRPPEETLPEEKKKIELKDSRILIVEDNLLNQKTLILTLNPYVSYIDTATNGQEAVEKLESTDYDIILMDIRMPVMDGLLATEKIRAIESSRNRYTPVIAITAEAMPGDEERCFMAGIDDYISKPFEPSTLLEKLEKILK